MHQPKTPVKAIRAKCLDCNGTTNEVKLCATTGCPLWAWRFGMRPATAEIKGKLMDPDETILSGFQSCARELGQGAPKFTAEWLADDAAEHLPKFELPVIQSSPSKTVRSMCLECAGSAHEVSACDLTGCPLHPFRLGKNPYRRQRTVSEEERTSAAARIREINARRRRDSARQNPVEA